MTIEAENRVLALASKFGLENVYKGYVILNEASYCIIDANNQNFIAKGTRGGEYELSANQVRDNFKK